MRPEPKFDKLMALSELNQGDKVKISTGQVAEFIRLKQKNFEGMIDGKPYNISVNSFVEVVEKADANAKAKKLQADIATLKQGELFYIMLNGNAVLYRFEGVRGVNIHASHPITNGKAKIHSSLYGGKVSDL